MGYRSNFKNKYIVSTEYGDFKTLYDALTFLTSNMSASTLLQLDGGIQYANDTYTINLPYNLKIEGCGVDTTYIYSTTGLTNKPLFNIYTNCDINKLTLYGGNLTSYSTISSETCLNIMSNSLYCEFKDIDINKFYCGISNKKGSEIWLFDSAIRNCTSNGYCIDTTSSGSTNRMSECTFQYNTVGVNMISSVTSYVSVEMCSFVCTSTAQTLIKYDGTKFNYSEIVIKNNMNHNESGLFLSGFDFTLASGRDVGIFVNGNLGVEDKHPHAKINCLLNTGITTITSSGTFYKASFTNTDSYTCKMLVENNRLTYLRPKPMDCVMWCSISLQTTNNSRRLAGAIYKNGNTKLGEMAVWCPTGAQSNSLSMVAYLPDVKYGDFFELWVTNYTASQNIIVEDVQMFFNAM